MHSAGQGALAAAALAAAALTLLAPRGAAAQACDSPNACYSAGGQQLLNRNYGSAIASFERGYALDQNGLFLYGIALSHAGLGNLDAALSYAERAASAPLPDDKRNLVAGLARAYALRLRAQEIAPAIARARAMAPPLPAPSPPAAEPIAARSEPLEVRLTDDEGLGWAGWGAIGFGALGAGSLVYATLLNQEVSDLTGERDQALTRAEFDRLDDEARDTQALGRIALGVGAGLATTGLILGIVRLASGGDRDEAVTLSMRPRAGGASIQVGGSF